MRVTPPCTWGTDLWYLRDPNLVLTYVAHQFIAYIYHTLKCQAFHLMLITAELEIERERERESANTVVSRIYAPFHIQFPLTFSVKVLEQVFSLSCNRSRTAKEFANNRKRVCEWYQCYSTLKGQTRGVLGNAAVYTVQVNLCQ